MNSRLVRGCHVSRKIVENSIAQRKLKLTTPFVSRQLFHALQAGNLEAEICTIMETKCKTEQPKSAKIPRFLRTEAHLFHVSNAKFFFL